MVEAIGMEVFGTASLSTFEYICAYAFIFYPLVSLPLLTYYWLKASENGTGNSLMGFEVPLALKKKQEEAIVSPLSTTEVPDISENTSEVISSTGLHNITFIGRRNKRAETKAIRPNDDSNILRVVETDDLLSAARKVALSSESTAKLRAAALDFLISSQGRDRFYKQKTSSHEVLSNFESSASSF